MINIFDVAFYLLEKTEDNPDSYSGHSLNAQLYELQALHLVKFDEPLFPEDFQAWSRGPVNRELWDLLMVHRDVYGSFSPKAVVWHCGALSEGLDNVNKVCIDNWLDMMNCSPRESSFHLETLRRHLPWKEARRGFDSAERCANLISKERMKIFYSLLWKMQKDLRDAGFLEPYEG